MKKIFSGIIISFAVCVFTAACGNSGTASEENKQAETNSFAGKVTFVELGAATCTPCQMMQKVMEQMKAQYSNSINIVFYDINTPDGRPYAAKYGIRVIPTQVFLDTDGMEYFRHEGYFPFEAVANILKMKGVE